MAASFNTRTGRPKAFEIKVHPAATEVVRVVQDSAMQDRPRISDGDDIVAPTGSQPFDSGHHLLRRHLGAGYEPLRRLLPGGEYLYVRPADIDG